MKILLSTIVTLLTVVFAFAERPTEMAFKGVELYSWKSASGDWMYAVLPGTNRVKPVDYIKSHATVTKDPETLSKSFLKLAEGQKIFWRRRGNKQFSYPPASVLKRVDKLGNASKVKIVREVENK